MYGELQASLQSYFYVVCAMSVLSAGVLRISEQILLLSPTFIFGEEKLVSLTFPMELEKPVEWSMAESQNQDLAFGIVAF